MRRTCVWVSAFRNSVIHKILSEFLQPFRYVGMTRVFPVPRSWSSFLFGFGILVGSCNSCSSDVSEEYGFLLTCLSTLSLDTIAGGWSVPEYGSHRSCLATLSLDTVEGFMDVEVSKLEEELADKPGTTIGTKLSVLHCIRTPFLNEMCFWPLIHSYEYPCSSQSFPSDNTAGVSSIKFIVKNTSNSLTYTVASSFVCTSPLAVITVVGLLDVVTVSNSAEFKSIFLNMCIDALESTTNSPFLWV